MSESRGRHDLTRIRVELSGCVLRHVGIRKVSFGLADAESGATLAFSDHGRPLLPILERRKQA